MDALANDFSVVKEKTTFLAEMVPGGKPYTDISGNISVGSPGMLQGLTRYLRGESRAYTEEYSTSAVDTISRFLERFMEHVRWNAVGDDTHELYAEVGSHIEKCVEGLSMLHSTYENAETFESLRTRLQSSVSLFKAGCKRYGTIADFRG